MMQEVYDQIPFIPPAHTFKKRLIHYLSFSVLMIYLYYISKKFIFAFGLGMVSTIIAFEIDEKIIDYCASFNPQMAPFSKVEFEEDEYDDKCDSDSDGEYEKKKNN